MTSPPQSLMLDAISVGKAESSSVQTDVSKDKSNGQKKILFNNKARACQHQKINVNVL